MLKRLSQHSLAEKRLGCQEGEPRVRERSWYLGVEKFQSSAEVAKRIGKDKITVSRNSANGGGRGRSKGKE